MGCPYGISIWDIGYQWDIDMDDDGLWDIDMDGVSI
jgi:hypothetical protein